MPVPVLIRSSGIKGLDIFLNSPPSPKEKELRESSNLSCTFLMTHVQVVEHSIECLVVGPTAVAHTFVLEAARERSTRRLHMLLLMEAWSLRMHLIHTVRDDTGAMESIMRANGISFVRQDADALENLGAEDNDLLDVGVRHKRGHRRKGKHRDRSKKHKRKRRELEIDSEDDGSGVGGDDKAHASNSNALWHVPCVQGTSVAVGLNSSELSEALVEYALVFWTKVQKS